MRIFSAGVAIVATILLVIFYFVPAFRGDIPVSPDFHIGFVRIHWYGLLLAIGILVGYLAATKLAPRFSLRRNAVEEVFLWLVIFGFLGARIYYVAFFWNYFKNHILETMAFWQGGISIYGAVAFGTLGGFIYAKRNKLKFMNLLGLGFLVLPIGQAIGRFGNFFNQEAFGSPTSLPWGLYIPPIARPSQYLANRFFHPTFLYESLWDLLVFTILLYLMRSEPHESEISGRIAASYLVLYGIGRFFIESLRLDSFYVLSFRVDQLTSLLAVLIGLAILIINRSYLARRIKI